MPLDDNSENHSNIPNKVILGMFVILVFLSSLNGIIGVLTVGRPSSSDPVFHQKLAEGWLNGDFPLLNEKYFLFGGPYPPAFHLTIAILSKIFFTSPLTIMNLFQIFLFPLILLSTFYLVAKSTDLYTALLSISFLLTSTGFQDRASQVIPQAFDILLFPIVIYFFMKKRKKEFIIISVFLIYNHGIYPILILTSLLIYSMRYEGERRKEFFKIAVYSLPLFLIMSPFLISASAPATLINSAQKDLFFNKSFYGVFYFSYFLFAATAISLYYIRNKNRTEFENILILWSLSLIPLFPFFPDRFVSYVVQPIAILNGIVFGRIFIKKRTNSIFLFFMFLVAILHIGIIFTLFHKDIQVWKMNEIAQIYVNLPLTILTRVFS